MLQNQYYQKKIGKVGEISREYIQCTWTKSDFVNFIESFHILVCKKPRLLF